MRYLCILLVCSITFCISSCSCGDELFDKSPKIEDMPSVEDVKDIKGIDFLFISTRNERNKLDLLYSQGLECYKDREGRVLEKKIDLTKEQYEILLNLLHAKIGLHKKLLESKKEKSQADSKVAGEKNPKKKIEDQKDAYEDQLRQLNTKLDLLINKNLVDKKKYKDVINQLNGIIKNLISEDE